jgi:hypothetical protein
MVSTRANTIDAPASAVRPWLVQMGVITAAPTPMTGSNDAMTARRPVPRRRLKAVGGPEPNLE